MLPRYITPHVGSQARTTVLIFVGARLLLPRVSSCSRFSAYTVPPRIYKDNMKFPIIFAVMCGLAVGETTVNGVRASNVLGGPEQHASFSFVRPGLTQTSYAFNGPSSHQSFSSSIGNPHLAQRVLPNVANALAYRNPGLGYFSTAPVSTGYANTPYANPAGVPTNASPLSPTTYSYQQETPADQTTALAYLQQYQQYQQYLHQQAQTQNTQAPVQQTYSPEIATYQAQLGQHFALRQQQQQALLQFQAQAHAQNSQAPRHIPVHETASHQEVPEQVQLQQQQQQQQQQVQQPGQNLLGVAYSSAPSVAHVKVTGNGYKFNF